MVEEQQNVAQKRGLDAQDMHNSSSSTCSSADIRPPRRAKTTDVPEDVRSDPLLHTQAPRVSGQEEKNRSTAGNAPPAEQAVEHRGGAAGTVDAGSPSTRSYRRRDGGEKHQVDGPEAGGLGQSELTQQPLPSVELPRREEPPAAPPAAPLSPDDISTAAPLSPDDISKFEEDGFVMLKQAFAPEVAAACRESLWKRLRGEGIIRDDPSTWVNKVGLAEIYGMSSSPKKRRGYPWKDALSPRLVSAVEQLVGADAWEEFGCGWWVVTFPGFARPPWGAEGKWHCDGAHFRHYPHSREIGLLPIFLFSDVRPHGGGTAVIRGSHKTVAELVWNKAGTTGLTGPELSRAAREALLPAASEDIVETTGSAGDILLTHPLLLHARSTNLAPVQESGVRFMCHPAVPLKHHLDLHAPPETFSVAERIMWRACPWRAAGGLSDAGASSATTKPEQFNHSPVELPSQKGQWKGKARRRGARTPTPQKQDPDEASNLSTSKASDGGSGSSPEDVEAGQPGARMLQPDEASDHQAARGGHGDAAMGASCEKAAREAPDSDIAAEDIDAAVMEAMGFGGFGGSRG